MKGLARWIGYLVLGCVAFAWFAYRTFPYDQLKNWVESQANTALGGAVQVTIADVGPSWGTGIAIRDARVVLPRAGGKPTPVLTITDGTIRTGLFSLLSGTVRMTYDLTLDDGAVAGSAAWRDGQLALDTDWHGVPTGVLLASVADLGLMLDGTLDGNVELAVNPVQWRNAVGSLDMTFHNWKFPKGTKLNLGAFGELELDTIAPNLKLTGADGSHLECEIAKGTVSVATLQLVGGDFELKMTGKIYLEAVPANSRVNLKGTVKFGEALKANLPVQLLGPSDANDGSFPLELTGRLNKLVKRIGSLTL